jgi:hypothetical protein
MPGIGSGNPFPLELGGGPSTSEQFYDILRQAIGTGAAADEGTIDADWRMAQARGMRAAFCSDRAINQGFPDLLTDFIEVWEDMFFLEPRNLSDEERRQNIIDLWTRVIDASDPGIEADLQEIDPLFVTTNIDHTTARTTELGRAFEDDDPYDVDACGPQFNGGRTSTDWPNYSTEFLSIINYGITVGMLTQEAMRRIERAKTVLCESLPAWIDYMISIGTPTGLGFILDTDLLDVGSF